MTTHNVWLVPDDAEKAMMVVVEAVTLAEADEIAERKNEVAEKQGIATSYHVAAVGDEPAF